VSTVYATVNSFCVFLDYCAFLSKSISSFRPIDLAVIYGEYLAGVAVRSAVFLPHFCRVQSLIWRPNVGRSPKPRLTNFAECKLIDYSLATCWHWQLTSLFVYFSIRRAVLNWTHYLVHEKSAGECRFGRRSCQVQTNKKILHFLAVLWPQSKLRIIR